MTTEELLLYVQNQKSKNVSNEIITSRLADAGWRAEDIQEAFRKLSPLETEAPKSTPAPVHSDPYREAPVVAEPISAKVIPAQSQKPEPPKVWTPTQSPSPAAPVASQSEPPKNIPIIPAGVPLNPKPIAPSSTMANTMPAGGIIAKKEQFVAPTAPQMPTPELDPSAAQASSANPFLLSKAPVVATPLPGIQPATQTIVEPSISSTVPSGDISKAALLSSYPKDTASSFVMQERSSGIPKWIVWIFIILVLGALAGGGVFAYTQGLIAIPKINLPFDIPFLKSITGEKAATSELATNVQNTAALNLECANFTEKDLPKTDLPEICIDKILADANGKFLKESKLFTTVPVLGAVNDETIRKVQDFLKTNGYYAGEINGNYDQATYDAVEKYRLASGVFSVPSTRTGLSEQLLYDIATHIRPLEGGEVSIASPLPGTKIEVGREFELKINYGPLVTSIQIDSPGFANEFRGYEIPKSNFSNGVASVKVKADYIPYTFGLNNVEVSAKDDGGGIMAVHERLDFYTNAKPDDISNQQPNGIYTINMTDRPQTVGLNFLAVFNKHKSSVGFIDVIPVLDDKDDVVELVPQMDSGSNAPLFYYLKAKKPGKAALKVTFNGFMKSFPIIVK